MDDCRWFFSIDPMKIPPFGLQFHRHAALHVLHGVQTLRLPRLPGKPRDVHDVHDVHGISWDHVQLRGLVETDLWHKRHDQNRTKKIGWWQKKTAAIWIFSVSLLWGQHLGHLTNGIHDSPVGRWALQPHDPCQPHADPGRRQRMEGTHQIHQQILGLSPTIRLVFSLVKNPWLLRENHFQTQ